jgi:hypothetical protein
MFSFALAFWRRCSRRSLPARVSAAGHGAPIVVATTASAVLVTSDAHGLHTAAADARSRAARKENQCTFTSTGIHVFAGAAMARGGKEGV